MEISDAVVSKS